jgi:hypothetical protein
MAVAALAGCTSSSKPPVVAVVTGRGGVVVGGGMALPEQLLEPPIVTSADRQLAKNKRTGRLCDALQTLDDLPEPSDDVTKLSAYAANVYGIVSTIDFAKKLDDEHHMATVPVPAEIIDVLKDMQAQAYAYTTRMNSINGLRADLLKRSADLHVTRAQVDAAVAGLADQALVQLLNSSQTADVRRLEQARPVLCTTQA